MSVNINDADWQKIQELFAKERQWMTDQMQKHIREVNEMFYDERKRVRERYKEYNETYLGHYVQYFFWFFCVIGIVIFGLTIFLLLDIHYHWSKSSNVPSMACGIHFGKVLCTEGRASQALSVARRPLG